MSLCDLATAYEQVLRKRFPGVRVRPDPDLAPAGHDVLAVFCVPDERLTEYAGFMLDEAPALLRARDIPRVTLIPHSVTVTRTHYPELWAALFPATTVVDAGHRWTAKSAVRVTGRDTEAVSSYIGQPQVILDTPTDNLAPVEVAA
ncbi:MAG: hypothetical protein NTW87_19685 [Planctomycetota bacterium]|nr:hypothetical protein [Planctomycetota bacterium]